MGKSLKSGSKNHLVNLSILTKLFCLVNHLDLGTNLIKYSYGTCFRSKNWIPLFVLQQIQKRNYTRLKDRSSQKQGNVQAWIRLLTN